MSKIKSNIKNISDDAESLVRDYMKLLLVKQTEKLALFLGIITTVFIVFFIFFLLLAFSVFVFGAFLNGLLDAEYLGYMIVIGLYILIITMLVIFIIKTRTPIFSNLFVKIIVLILNVDIQDQKSIKGLRRENENVKLRIETNTQKLKTDAEMIRYVIIESLFSEFFGLFTSKKKSQEPEKDQSSSQDSDKK